MEQFTIYYGTPEGKDTKIGVDCEYPSRIKDQKIRDGQVLEVHTCVYEVSDREMELQREYGVRVDDVPYYVTYFKNKNPEQRAKISASLIGKPAHNKGMPMTQKQKTKISAARRGIILTEEHKAKIGASSKGIPKPQKQVQCPHCLKAGGTNAMKRWHFDNCKHIYTMNE